MKQFILPIGKYVLQESTPIQHCWELHFLQGLSHRHTFKRFEHNEYL